MDGTNELELGHDETCKAIEYYLNNVVFKRPIKVTGLRSNTDAVSASVNPGRQIYRVKMIIDFVDDAPLSGRVD